ncbi:MAG: glutathionylspermidine synthase [Spirosomataceae bacterium]|jgi:glutathionylspermidine synthase
MEHQDHSVLLADNRFLKLSKTKKKDTPFRLDYFAGLDDYLSNEILCIKREELDLLTTQSHKAREIFEDATDRVIRKNQLGEFGVPTYFQEAIIKTWQEKENHPLLLGRFDLCGGFDRFFSLPKVIEFNADTCTTIPESTIWQDLQMKKNGTSFQQLNTTSDDLEKIIQKITLKIAGDLNIPTKEINFLGTSLDYIEDRENVLTVLDAIPAENKNNPSVAYRPLADLTFDAKEGIFYELPNGEFLKVDIMFKMIPWDWIFANEPELAKLLASIIMKDQCVIVNPPYTTLWQNKKFLSYITKYYPNNGVIAETYDEQYNYGNSFVKKPIYGRLGENISVIKNGKTVVNSSGDFESQQMVYQNYYPLLKDTDGYSYQIGIFTNAVNKASGLNFRYQKSEIITDECDFMAHQII